MTSHQAPKTRWMLDESGRLLTPQGEFVAMFRDGVILFYDRKQRIYEPFTLADWWALMSKEQDSGGPGAPGGPTRRPNAAGAWGG